ncbi:GPI-anchored wall transfer protein 1, putative (GWT1), partial [Plasmodium malariae]
MSELSKVTRNKNTFSYGNKRKSGKYSLHYEEYLYDMGKSYFEIILKNKKDIRKMQEANYDIIMEHYSSNRNEYELEL